MDHRRVLAVARDIGDRNYQFEAHQGLGWVHRATGDFDRALASHTAALELAGDLGQPQDQDRARDGLAHAHLALGHPGRAGRHWRAALDALAAHGIDHTGDPQVTAETIRARLAGLQPRETGATGRQRS